MGKPHDHVARPLGNHNGAANRSDSEKQAVRKAEDEAPSKYKTRRGTGGRKRKDGKGGRKGGKGCREPEPADRVRWRLENALWAVKWRDFCDREGGRGHDPSEQPVAFLERALRLLPWTGGDASGKRMQDEQRLVDYIQTRLHETGYRTRWTDFCFAYGNGTLDPQLHSYTFLRAANDCVGFDVAVTRNHRQLVEKVSASLAGSPVWRAHWHRFCEQNSDGNREPRAHEPFFLKKAIEELGRWEKENQRRVELAERVNERQGEEPAFRVRWVDYCKQFNKATFVPKELRPETPGKGLARDALFFKSSFLDLAWRDLASPDEVHRVGLRNAAPTAAFVAAINEKQADASWSAAWKDYCAKNSDGSDDPSLHDAAFLRRALRVLDDCPGAEAAHTNEIQALCAERMDALNRKDSVHAAALKTKLWSLGVELYDSTKTWRSDEGVTGSFRDPNEVNLSQP
ncbi:hypothetical protein DIPPA_23116 [Diplonema papillatum]|nr:hypothetical protein DIPPA_23116 [Diplonema papillatum]